MNYPPSRLGAEVGPRLTATSYIVLGLLEQAEPATPYDLKRLAQRSTMNLWSVPHTQLYTECARLAKRDLLSEQRERGGRHRRIYRLAQCGRQALEAWRAEPTTELCEARDIGILKLFFGSDSALLGAAQLEAHRRQLRAYEQLHNDNPDAPRGPRLALEARIGQEREFVRFWSQVNEDERLHK